MNQELEPVEFHDQVLAAAAHSEQGPPSERAERRLVRLQHVDARCERRLDGRAGHRRGDSPCGDLDFGKLGQAGSADEDEAVATLGPEAWPEPPPLEGLLDAPRPLHALLRDQRVIAGIGRSWADEILHAAMLSPFKRGSDLTEREAETLRAATAEVLGNAIEHYERAVELPIPDKLPMPLTVHRHEGEPCPRCQRTLERVFFEDYVIAYCPDCQTGARVLKDRRLSRLLK